jgi:PKD repeat protein
MTTYEYDAFGNRTLMRVTGATLDKPITAFTTEPTEGMAPLQVAFKDASSGVIESWTWDFGDGTASQEHHPLHTYTEPGIYTVKLTAAHRDNSETLTKTDLINVASPHGPDPE